MKVAIVIPARLESTRLPRKLLLDETGCSLIEHTWRAATGSSAASQVIVATDSQEIKTVVERFGGTAVLTSAEHRSGSDRVAEAAASIDAELIVNLQGDEPEIESESIDQLIAALADEPDCPVATLATPIREPGALLEPACVKVVFDGKGRALYFSRNPIPASRDEAELQHYFSQPISVQSALYFQHIGVYACQREFLMRIPQLPPAKMELAESLEQLRFLHHGFRIEVVPIEHSWPGIDTAEDYALFVNRWQSR